jgi:hypothetical protein
MGPRRTGYEYLNTALFTLPMKVLLWSSLLFPALNKEIAEDPLLGENYQIGHSFFCPKGGKVTELSFN